LGADIISSRSNNILVRGEAPLFLFYFFFVCVQKNPREDTQNDGKAKAYLYLFSLAYIPAAAGSARVSSIPFYELLIYFSLLFSLVLFFSLNNRKLICGRPYRARECQVKY
jgi:hypothetical protein